MITSRKLTVVLATLLVAASPAGVTAAGDGVTRREIKIGVHLPMTGASALLNDSASDGARVFWRWLRRQDKPINGRHVRVVTRNDNSNPSQAVAVCREMVEDEGVFMLAGFIQATGVDQVQACARYAASVGIPYISLGMTKIGLNLPRYFAISATWPREARLLANLLVRRHGAGRDKNGILWQDMPNFKDTRDAFAGALKKRKASVDYNRSVPKSASQTDAQVVVQEMKAAGIDNVFVMARPLWFLQVLQSARTQQFRPLWSGTSTIALSGNATAKVGCRNGTIGRSRFLSPIPAFTDRDRFDPRHDRAMRAIYGENGDPITWLGWAGSKAIAKMLEGAGRDLTRRRFVRVTERDERFATGILPPFGFTPQDHFGGRSAFVLKADCQSEEWTTLRRFGGRL